MRAGQWAQKNDAADKLDCLVEDFKVLPSPVGDLAQHQIAHRRPSPLRQMHSAR
jgi:hypothetical protein